MAGRTAESSSMENSSPKIKICVMGGGFTGILTALSFKRHFSNHEVLLIDPGKEMQYPGLGLSMPGRSTALLMQALQVPSEQRQSLLHKWIKETNSTIKLQFKFQDWCDKSYPGWLGNTPTQPSADVVKFPAMLTDELNQQVLNPDVTQYKLFDLWYELLQSGRRTWLDANGDTNHYHWYCKYHTVPESSVFNVLPTLHINSWDFGDWLKKNLAAELDRIFDTDIQSANFSPDGAVDVVVLEDGTKVKADYYIDCTGFRRVLGRALKSKFVRPVCLAPNNSAVVVGQGYSNQIDMEMHPYTIGYGMDFGWTNCIPMKHAKSYGYIYNNHWITQDQALQELQKLAPSKNCIYQPEFFQWEPGYFQNSMDKNYAMVGISSGFYDAFESHNVGMQFSQLFKIIDYIKQASTDFVEPMSKDHYNYNDITQRSIQSLAQRLDFFMCLAPRNSSEYWRHNHDLGVKHNLLQRLYDKLNDAEHHQTARKTQTYKAYPVHVYYNDGLHWGLDFSKRSRNSSQDMLELADAYFSSFNKLNQMRARMSPSIRQYYQSFGVDLAALQTLQ